MAISTRTYYFRFRLFLVRVQNGMHPCNCCTSMWFYSEYSQFAIREWKIDGDISDRSIQFPISRTNRICKLFATTQTWTNWKWLTHFSLSFTEFVSSGIYIYSNANEVTRHVALSISRRRTNSHSMTDLLIFDFIFNLFELLQSSSRYWIPIHTSNGVNLWLDKAFLFDMDIFYLV